ncbi:MAG: alanine racemase [Chlamydiia bacterium]|nr:alanine racemase [Chlamydiia bacterium]
MRSKLSLPHQGLRSSTLEIDLDAIDYNLQAIQEHLGAVQIFAVLKAGAYGTAMLPLARQLQDKVGGIAVATVDEGAHLRKSGIDSTLLILSPPTERQWTRALRLQLEVCVGSSKQVEAAERSAASLGLQASLHLNIDTGMARHGCGMEEAVALADHIYNSPHLLLAGAMSHPSCADDPRCDAHTTVQVRLFRAVIERIEERLGEVPLLHFANSAFALRFPDEHFGAARIGLALFGVETSIDSPLSLPLRLALKLSTPVLAIREVPEGWPIGYGAMTRAPAGGLRIASLGLGYHDGMHRHASPGAFVLLHGQRAPLVGRVSMDACVVDVSAIPEARVGDNAELFGPSLRPEVAAAAAGTIPHELLACLGPRIRRSLIRPTHH